MKVIIANSKQAQNDERTEQSKNAQWNPPCFSLRWQETTTVRRERQRLCAWQKYVSSLMQTCRDFLLKYIWLMIMNVNFINGEEFHLHLWCPVSFPQSGCLPTCGCNSENPFKDKIWLHFYICIILSMTLESIFLYQLLCNTLRSFENRKKWQKTTLDHWVFLEREFE